MSDPDISYLYEEYEKVIEIFKEAHKENEALKDSAQSLSELRADITAMDQEKDSVQKKIEKLMKKVCIVVSRVMETQRNEPKTTEIPFIYILFYFRFYDFQGRSKQ